MRILALDTATESCSAALWVDGEIAERRELAPQQHAGLILPWIDALMSEAELSVSALDAVAVSVGPGSFTGIRIGFAVAQGIAVAGELGLVPLSTLRVLAAGVEREDGTPVLAILDARLSQVYAGGYAHDGIEDGAALLTDRVCSPEQLVAAAAGRDWIAVGPGLSAYHEQLSAIHIVQAFADRLPHAATVARLAAAQLAGGLAPMAPDEAQPFYLRNRVTG